MYRVIMVKNRQVSSMNPQPAEVLRIVKLKVLFEFVTGLVALLVFPFGGAASAGHWAACGWDPLGK